MTKRTTAAHLLGSAVASICCKPSWASSAFIVTPQIQSRRGGLAPRIRHSSQPPRARYRGDGGRLPFSLASAAAAADEADSQLIGDAQTTPSEAKQAPQAQAPGATQSVLDLNNAAVLDAAATLTISTSTLLGTKSIGVDYGTVRTGLAVTIGYDPLPVSIVADLNNTQLANEVIHLCSSESASQVVVGLPLHKNGTESNTSGLARQFASELSGLCLGKFGPEFRVYLWDERYSSKEAAARVLSSNPRVRSVNELTGTIDADAACIILEHYYADGGLNAERVPVPEGMLGPCLEAWEAQRVENERAADAVRVGREVSLNARQAAMERAKVMEAKLAESGTLGTSRKKGKKNKKKKKKKGSGGGGKNWIIM